MSTNASPVEVARARPWRLKLAWFAAEITVVVAGVLIALALNAWGNRLQEYKAAASLRTELQRDISASRTIIAQALETHRRLATDARNVLKVMSTSSSDSLRDAVLSRIGSIFVLVTFDPVNDTYTEALGSGRFNLIRDPELRLALSRYQSRLRTIAEFTELIARQYYDELEPFMVARTVYSEIAYDRRREGLVQAPFKTDFHALARSRELWNLVTLRLEWELALQQYLTELDARAEDALRHLR